MKKKLTLLFFLIGISLTQAQDKKEFEVNFATDSYLLNTSETNKLNTFIQSLPNQHERYTVAIAGHTDNVGDIAYNAVLSDKRANTIAGFFKDKGFLESRVLTSGRGEVHPVADNSNETGKAKNRRVKIIVSLEAENKIAKKGKAATSGKVNDIGGLKLEETSYTIDAGKDEMVTYSSGTKIKIQKNTFVDKNGKIITGKVDLKYIEYRDPIDFILSNIKMDHGDGHFNSGGMFKILAYQNGAPVYLGKGKNLDIDFMLTDNLPEMNFYQYDSLSGKWSEKSKLIATIDVMEEDEGLENEKTDRADIVRTSTIFLGGVDTNAPMCTASDCASLYALKRIAASLTEPGASGHKRWGSYRKERDSALFAIRSQKDSIYRANPKLLSESQWYHLKAAEKKLADREAALGGLHLKMKRMIPQYTVKKLKSKDGISLRISLKAIYNIETANFRQTWWQYTGSQALDKKLFNTKWEHCQIRSNADGTFTALLEKETEKVEVGPLKIITDSKDTKELVASMNQAEIIQKNKIAGMQTQVKTAELRICEAQAEIDQAKNIPLNMLTNCSDLDEVNNPMLCFHDRSEDYMAIEEQSMSVGDWFKYFDANKEMMKTRYENIAVDAECQRLAELKVQNQKKMAFANRNAKAATQSLKISNLGVYNCDQIDRLIEPLLVDAQYQSENGDTIKPLFIYLVDSRINGIIRYDGYMRYSPDHFAYSRHSANTLLAFDGDGGSYILKADGFKNAVTGNSTGVKATFVMKKIENMKNRESLEDLF